MTPTRVFAWAADMAGCGYFRCGLPMFHLGQQPGYETAASPQLLAPWLSTDAKVPDALASFDVMIGQRVCKPGATDIWQAACQTPGLRTVFEMDDDLFHIDPSNRKAYEWFGQPEIRANLKANIRAADAVTVTTEPLADVVREMNPNVHVIPNYIPAAWLDLPPIPPSDRVRVGWAGSGPNHLMDFREAGPQIARFVRRNETRVELVTIGGDMFKQFGAPSTVIPGAKEVAEYHARHEFDVGVAPLASHPFNRSKSSLKALHYMARGIVPVVSDEPPYRGTVIPGVNGYLVRREYEWGHFLNRLVQSPTLRAELRHGSLQTAREHLIEDHVTEWADALGAAHAVV